MGFLTKVGLFFAGMVLELGTILVAMDSTPAGVLVLIGGFLFSAFVTGALFRNKGQGWPSYFFGIVTAGLWGALYYLSVVLAIFLFFLDGPRSGPGWVARHAVEDDAPNEKTKQQKHTKKKYDARGNYAGVTLADGKKYDEMGNYAGQVTEDGKHWAADGSYDGQTVGSKRYAADGSLLTQATADGKIYDAGGDYAGQILREPSS